MFIPKTKLIEKLAYKHKIRIEELEKIFDKRSNVYIDFANVINWQTRLGWHIDLKRLKQFLNSFTTIKEIKFYNGLLEGDEKSLNILNQVKENGYLVRTKTVKVIKLSIDVSSINIESPTILKNFIRQPLLKKLKIETIQYLNNQLKELNNQGIKELYDLKCNFDVEISIDMLIDCEKNKADNFILWSGDSDFFDLITMLFSRKKKVVVFSTARRVSRELNDLRKKGLFIFDIQKIKEFICWKKELNH